LNQTDPDSLYFTGDGGTEYQVPAPVRMMEGKTIKVTPGKVFDLPVCVTGSMEVGAFSLTINLSSGLFEVKDVVIPRSDVPVNYSVTDNRLLLSWKSHVPVKLEEGETLFILKLRSPSSVRGNEYFRPAIGEDSEGEILTGKNKHVNEAILKSDIVIVSGIVMGDKSNELTLKLYPNPSKGPVTVDYTLPSDGQVTIVVFNSIGAVVKTLVNESKSYGSYSVGFDAGLIPYGIYFVKIKLHTDQADLVHVLRFVVNR